jgi:translation initiation factor 3 subunit L
MPEDPDACVPQVVTDFLFDLYDSVTLSMLPSEQSKLYLTDLPDLSQKYFSTSPWPSATSIASECNGDPLFLAVYREMTHRHWHSMSRPTVADNMDGWDVYRELFDEILEGTPNFYLIPTWVFEILFEFVYQFQGFCQIKTAVYAAAKKYNLLDTSGAGKDGTELAPSTTSGKHQQLADNLQLLQSNTEAWDVGMVFMYLHRLMAVGFPVEAAVSAASENGPTTIQPVYSYFAAFSAIAKSRLECLLADYTGCLQALDVLHAQSGTAVAKTLDDSPPETIQAVVNSVVAARISLSYHAGVAYLQLRRYQDAAAILTSCASFLQRGFKTGTVRHDQFNKQYERILSLLAILMHICPALSTSTTTTDEAVFRAVREKHPVSKLEASSSLDEWFQSPQFINADSVSGVSMHKHQVALFNKSMEPVVPGKNLRSFLKLYTSLPVAKLAAFHDQSETEFLPLLLSYKARMRQMERSNESESFSGGTYKSALDIHYYVENDTVLIDEAELQRRFETYFCNQIAQVCEIRQDAIAIDPTV